MWLEASRLSTRLRDHTMEEEGEPPGGTGDMTAVVDCFTPIAPTGCHRRRHARRLRRRPQINPRWPGAGVTREQVVEGLRPLLALPVEHLLETHGGAPSTGRPSSARSLLSQAWCLPTLHLRLPYLTP